ncbi:sensor histidine kinase NtrY-like [Pleomorphomonas koreensis]|uniref:sensor histidine kinase NtrY-like n=1 Tax=Pleomorphomonas koreensis TaxID=257440 RepID=UPI00041A0FB3|nr:PAS domain-containing sensor histidine kinase [Pleomorphomonas koreensis]
MAAELSMGEAGAAPQPMAMKDVYAEGRGRRLTGLVLVAVATLFSLGTFALISNLLPVPPTTDVIRGTLVIDGLLLLAILFMVGQEVWKLGRAWIEGRAAARLHLRVVALFAFIAALPAVMVAMAFTLSLNQGFDHWFEARTRQVVDNVLTVASAYMQEHARVLRSDLISIATSLDAAKPLYDYEPTRFETLMRLQASLHGLQSAYLLDKNANVILRTDIDPSVTTVMPPPTAIEEARKGAAVLLQPGQSNQVGGLLKLRTYDETYLYIVRLLDKQVLDNLQLARDSAMEYRELENNRSDVQIGFAMIFGGMSVVFLLGAMWIGLSFANRLVAPIRHLIGAADRVAHGDLSAAVPVGNTSDDISSLGASFNKMTVELRSQRQELISASEEAERRRRFTEAVLSGVSAGVVGISNDGHVTIANASALSLLDVELFGFVGRLLVEEVPELSHLLAVALRDEDQARSHQATIDLTRGGRKSTVSVRVTPDRSPDREHGYVVTLDDISELVSAQRTSAWADVARRIAHEIKNPLTPIQLSAERIRRRFGKLVADDDRRVFDQCVDTIVRQVGDIGRMVDEFSQFARMPKPSFEERDLGECVREAVFLLGVGHPEITFEAHLPDAPLTGRFDQRLVSQAVTNLVKNAVEAIEGLPESGRAGARVDVYGRKDGGFNVIEVVDTGIGLPDAERHQLLEPYMTTREKGTGLGLAIVRKIVEEHGGSIDLLDSPTVAEGGHGALVRISLPVDPHRSG